MIYDCVVSVCKKWWEGELLKSRIRKEWMLWVCFATQWYEKVVRGVSSRAVTLMMELKLSSDYWLCVWLCFVMSEMGWVWRVCEWCVSENMTGGSLQEYEKRWAKISLSHMLGLLETKLRVKDSLTTNELSWMPFAMFYR